MPAYRDTLSPRQEMFIQHYLSNGFNATAAALSAGYSTRGADVRGSKLLGMPEVAAVIAAKKEKMLDKYEVTAEKVVRELALLGFSNMQDYMTVTEDGEPYMDLSALTRDQAAAIQQLDSETYVERGNFAQGDDEPRTVKKSRIRLHGKRDALELLGKYAGVFKEESGRTEVQVRVVLDGNKAAVAVGVSKD